MQRITLPGPDSWVYVTHEFAKEKSIKQIRSDVRRKIFQCQCWLFDLDDNHAPSPGKMLARKAVGASHFSPSYLSWCAGAAYNLARKRRGAETKMWKEYVSRFLRDEKALERIAAMFTSSVVEESLYAGVREFLYLLENSKKFYVTRNIRGVVQAYSGFLGFDGFYAEASSKAAVAEEFVWDRPHFRFYGVEGDSEEDAGMVAALRFHGKDVTGILSSDRPVDINDAVFDINVSKDRGSLVDILRK